LDSRRLLYLQPNELFFKYREYDCQDNTQQDASCNGKIKFKAAFININITGQKASHFFATKNPGEKTYCGNYATGCKN